MKYKLIILTIFLTFFMSCQVSNVDPQRASSANPNAVLPFVFAEYSARKVTDVGTRMIDVVHTFGDTFNSPKNGNVPIFLSGNVWGIWYSNLLGNLELLKKDAIAAGETSNNIQAMSLIMQAHLFFELTCIWERIPFTEALDGTQFPEPNFDDQPTVLRGVVNMYDQAISLIDAMPATDNFDFSFGDLIYGGNMVNWRKLANSFKLRTLMVIRNVEGSAVDDQIIATLGEDLIESNSEVASFKYPGGPGAQNGFFNLINAFFGPSNEKAEVFGPSPTYRDLLIKYDDPRLGLFLVNLSGVGNYPTVQYDQFPNSMTTVFADNVIKETLPDIYYLPAETFFYRAELALKNVATGDDANTMFEMGVRRILEYWDGEIGGDPVTAAAITTFLGAIPDLGSLSQANALREVHEQQYLETTFRPIVTWNHVRRTRIPELSPPPSSSISTILKRFPYPPDEAGSNPNTPPNLATDMPMWFENL